MRLLGGFALECNGSRCDPSFEKGRALLAYLALHLGKELPRAELAALLWPDFEHQAGLANLRQVLHELRRKLGSASDGAPPLAISRSTIRLDPLARVDIDALDFAAPASICPATRNRNDCTACLAHMENLGTRYQGHFLAGFSLSDCPEFDEWMQTQRESLRQRALQLLARLCDCHERMGNYARALPYAQRFHEFEPWDDAGLRRLMRLLALNGQATAALAAYANACRTLERDLGLQAQEETHKLAQRIRRDELAPTSRRRGDAAPTLSTLERRPATALYCELRPTHASEPEAALARLRAPLADCGKTILDCGGRSWPVHGSAFFAYFSPGHGLDSSSALRAVEAGLALLRCMPAGVAAHIGIESGLMLVSDDPRQPDATGAISARALRLSQVRELKRGGVAIGAATHAQVAQRFDCLPLAARQFWSAGPEPSGFRVVAARSRCADAVPNLALIGRRAEMSVLLRHWLQVRHGQLRSVRVQGEAGIGKTRLLHELQQRVQRQNHLVWELHCQAEHSQSAFQPLSAFFSQQLGFAQDDAPALRSDKLAAFLERRHWDLPADSLALLNELLGLPARAPYPAPLQGNGTHRRARMLAAARHALALLAQQRPALLLVHGLQWADPSTLDFLHTLTDRPLPFPLLLLVTQLGSHPDWRGRLDRVLELQALNESDTVALVRAVAPGLGAQALRPIVARSDGVPLFALELARLTQQGTVATLPSSLYGLLSAQLQAVGAAQWVAQKASVIGREFDLGLLRAVAGFDSDWLVQQLRVLTDAGIVTPPVAAAGWRFRLALMREVAYQSLSQAERETVHCRVADALTLVQARPEVVAQHWCSGGNIERAIGAWISAGRLATRQSACVESQAHFRHGLGLLDRLPGNANRDRLEIDLQIGLGTALSAAQGYATPAAAAAYRRAQYLCARDSALRGTFPSVWGLWASASSRLGFPSALKVAQRLRHMAATSADPVEQQQSAFAMGNTLFWHGQFTQARTLLESARGLAHDEQHSRQVEAFGEDGAVTCRAYLAWTLRYLGEFEAAQAQSDAAIALARRLGHDYSLAYALTFAALLRCQLHQPQQAQALAEEALTLADCHAFTLWQLGARIAMGWSQAMLGQRGGLLVLQECVQGTRQAMGGVILAALLPLASACLALGEAEQARTLLEEAVQTGAALGDHHADAELQCLLAEALLGLPHPEPELASACLRAALGISRKQEALALELQASLALTQLLKRSNAHQQPSRSLAALCARFPTPSAHPDVVQARQLLRSLEAAGPEGARFQAAAPGVL